MKKPTTADLRKFFAEKFPQAAVTIDGSGPGYCRVRQEIRTEHLRPGETVAGPVMVWLADCATYGAVLTEIGIVPLAVTTNLSINFLRKPNAKSALIAEAHLLKLGQRLAVAEVKIFAECVPKVIAHATLTYSIPPNEQAIQQ